MPAAAMPLPFASCYAYSPRGLGRAAQHSRWVREMLKAHDGRFMNCYAARIRWLLDENNLSFHYFKPQSILIPVPGRAPRSFRATATTSPQYLAQALLAEGLGQRIWNGLHRTHAVHKSATAAPGRRPSVSMHYDSFDVAKTMIGPGEFVLIDDVVTKGRTLLAAAMRLRESYPGVRVSAFALLRTMGSSREIARLLAPCSGTIRFGSGDARRMP